MTLDSELKLFVGALLVAVIQFDILRQLNLVMP